MLAWTLTTCTIGPSERRHVRADFRYSSVCKDALSPVAITLSIILLTTLVITLHWVPAKANSMS